MRTLHHDPESGCGECLFFSERGRDRCEVFATPGVGHTGRRLHDTHTAPEWCPLRSGSVLVSATRDERVASDGDRWRGHPIAETDDGWVYTDTGAPVAAEPDRRCGHCGLPNRADGHDACLGEIPGVMNACCGHGGPGAYVQPAPIGRAPLPVDLINRIVEEETACACDVCGCTDGHWRHNGAPCPNAPEERLRACYGLLETTEAAWKRVKAERDGAAALVGRWRESARQYEDDGYADIAADLRERADEVAEALGVTSG